MNRICYPESKKNWSKKPTIPQPPDVSSMTLLAKLQELAEGKTIDPYRTKLLIDEIYKNVRQIDNPEVLINHFLEAIAFCWRQQKKLPDICLRYFEEKIIELLNDPRFLGFLKSRKGKYILDIFPSQKICSLLAPTKYMINY